MRWQPTAGDLENTDLLVKGIEAKVHRAGQGQGDSGIAIIIIPTESIIVEKGLVEAVTIIKLKV